MVGLLDLAPSTRKVHGVRVSGISAQGLVSIISRFPELEALLGGMSAAGIKARDLLSLAPAAIKAIIAAGIGYPGDEHQEAAAATLSIELQADFLEAIIAVTLPSGFGPFVERLTRLGTAAESFSGSSTAPRMNGQTVTVPAEPGEDPYTKLRKRSTKLKRGESRPLG